MRLFLGLLVLVPFAVSGCFDTTLEVTVQNNADTVQEVPLLIVPKGSLHPHWNKTVLLDPGATAHFSVAHTTGMYRWTASTAVTCSVDQDVGSGDYRWTVVVGSNGIHQEFFLDDAVASPTCIAGV